MPVNRHTPLLSEQDEYLARFAACAEKPSDYSFANIYGWAEHYGLEWAFVSDCAWIRQTLPRPVWWAPVGAWETVDWAACPAMAEGGHFIRAPETLVTIWRETLGERVHTVEARDQWDYLYDVEALIHLKGNRFHKKKNLLRQFTKQYDYDYQPMTPNCVEEALELQAEWCQWRECDQSAALLAENIAVARVLKNWESLPGVFGASLRVGDEMVAFTVAEELTPETVVIHFEKGKPGVKGVYQAINQMFLEHEAHDYTIVNREQDLGDEGLRKAKLSYNPTAFLKKYAVDIDPA